MSTPDAPLLCPPDNRRSVAELVLKLAASHFTCVLAACHLLSIRRGKLTSWEPYLYLLCPLLPVIRLAIGLVLALLAFVFSILCFALRRRSDGTLTGVLEARRTFFLRLRILVGKGPGDGSHQWRRKKTPEWMVRRTRTVAVEAGEWAVAEGNDNDMAGVEKPSMWRQWRYVELWRVVALLWTGFLCCTTIHLFRRRVALAGWESVTMVDSRALEMAVGGVVVVVMSVAVVIGVPGFAEEVPAVDPSKGLSGFMLVFLSGLGVWEDSFLLASMNMAFSFPFCLVDGVPMVVYIKDLFPDVKMRHIYEAVVLVFCWVVGVYLFNVADGPLGEVLLHLYPDRGPTISNAFRFISMLIILASTICLFQTWIWLQIMLTTFPVLVPGGLLLVGSLRVCEMWMFWDMVSHISAWPADKACPGLWKDSVADWLLSIA